MAICYDKLFHLMIDKKISNSQLKDLAGVSAMVVFTGGGNGPFYGLQMKQSSQESIFYVQAILNHWLMELLVKSKASTFRGDYYSHGKQFIASLPIYRIGQVE